MSAKRNANVSTRPNKAAAITAGPMAPERKPIDGQPASVESAASNQAEIDPGDAGNETNAETGSPGEKAVAAAETTAAGAPAVVLEAAIIVFGLHEGAPQGSWFAAAEVELATKAAGMMGLRVVEVSSDEHRALANELRHGQVFAADRMFAPAIRRDLYDRLHALTDAKIPPRGVAHRPATLDDVDVGSLVLVSDGEDEGWWEALVAADRGTELQLRWYLYPRLPSFSRARSEIALLPAAAVVPAAAA